MNRLKSVSTSLTADRAKCSSVSEQESSTSSNLKVPAGPAVPGPSSNTNNIKTKPAENKEPTATKNKLVGKKINNKSFCLADFEMGRQLGEGKLLSNIFLAREKKNHRTVALQIILKSQQFLLDHRVRHEINMHYRLRHPNILRMYGFFEDETRIYLVLEYAEQGSLSKLLQKHRRLDEKTAAIFVRDVTRALLYCQSENVIPKHIKPENILIGWNSVLKIGYCGWSIRSRPTCRMTRSLEPQDNMSLELLDHKYNNYGDDIWSLGVLCYELLVGLSTFNDKDPHELLKMKRDVDIRYPYYISDEAKDLMGKLLTNPNVRLTLANMLNHPWIVTNAPEGETPPVFKTQESMSSHDLWSY